MNEYNIVDINIKLLLQILSIQSPSEKEEDMSVFIADYIEKFHPECDIDIDNYGSIYITKGVLNEGEFYPCIVAHQDEVHSKDDDKKVFQLDNFILAWNVRDGSQDGLGADDKVGIFIALTLLSKFDKIKLFFPVEEEIGSIGTHRADMTWFKDVGYAMQPDRHGDSDFISRTNGLNVTSDKFIEDIMYLLENYEYEESIGSFTDIGVLSSRGIGVSTCNMSCGYWDEHSEEEICFIPAIANCLNLMYHIIDTCGYTKYEHEVTSMHLYNYTKALDLPYVDDYECPCDTCIDQDCLKCKVWING